MGMIPLIRCIIIFFFFFFYQDLGPAHFYKLIHSVHTIDYWLAVSYFWGIKYDLKCFKIFPYNIFLT